MAIESTGKFLSNHYLMRLTNATGMNPVKLVVRLTEEDEDVASVDHDLNQVFRTSALVLPADARYEEQWHLHQRLAEGLDHRIGHSMRSSPQQLVSDRSITCLKSIS